MFFSIQIWKLLAGVAIFLLGMNYMEDALQKLAGRPFKLFLRKHTSSKVKAILGGAFVTGILQSSSVVNLMILAFVGANIFQMQNALALMLGTNLGTTFDSWIVATIGFKLNIEKISLPLVALFGISTMLSSKESKWFHWSKFLFGFGFLFIGLDYMKSGMEAVVKNADLSTFSHAPAIVFLLIGLVVTALIQSSSATIAIVLSALHANALGLFAATAIVLGSEVGTTLKLIWASLKGHAAKKRVALGNFLFNIITISIVFIFLSPINRLIKDVLGITHNLLALVFFQTLVNIIGILLFYPFLNRLGKFLEKRFRSTDDETLFINKVNINDTALAMAALENEIKNSILLTIGFTRAIIGIPPDELLVKALSGNHEQKNRMDHYEYLKHLHGETHDYAIQLQNSIAAKDINKRLAQLIAANRNNMYAAKSLKDALPDIYQLSNSANDVKYSFYLQAADEADNFCKHITVLLLDTDKDQYFEELRKIYHTVSLNYSSKLEQLYKKNTGTYLNEIEISTLINFNREMYTAYKSYVFALKNYLLDDDQMSYFDDLPGFIR